MAISPTIATPGSPAPFRTLPCALLDGKKRMEKSIHTNDYAALLELVREVRQSAGLSQVQLAEKIGQSQSFVSKVEVGEWRLDLIQLRTIVRALGTTLPEFVRRLEEKLAEKE
jgi:ribosome-binding protein aMBF1 (putative translation factor)